MKYSRMIAPWNRKRLWFEFMLYPKKYREYIWNNKFELFCKQTIHEY